MTAVAKEIADGMRANVNPTATISGTIKVDMGTDGSLLIDGRSAPATIEVSDEPADCTLICSADTFVGLIDGTVDGMKAYMSGKLKITGNDKLADEMEKLFTA